MDTGTTDFTGDLIQPLQDIFELLEISVREEEVPDVLERQGRRQPDLAALAEQLLLDPLGLEVVEQVLGL
uniref:Uncharacterized protein n=1 Tax=Arundo donax TaxID=35708 RepID=A0A0A9GPL1_ARUDO